MSTELVDGVAGLGQFMMKAAVLNVGADAPDVEDVLAPQARSGQIELQVLAAALNPVDLLIAAGGHPTLHPTRPYIPGFEAVGRVLGDRTPLGGQRVWWMSDIGAFAERTVVDENRRFFPVPDELADDLAVSIGNAGRTAWLALVDRAQLRRGERVLILGATGAVGRFAIQIARLLGAGRIVAVGRSADDKLIRLGADAVVPFADGDDLLPRLLAVEPRGYDIIIDGVFGPVGEAALGAAAEGARIVIMGALAGPQVRLSTVIFDKCLTILGHRSSVSSSLAAQKNAYASLARYAVEGSLEVDREVLPLADIADAWRRQATSPHHKLVIVP